MNPMATDWQGVAFIAGFMGVAAGGVWLVVRLAVRDLERLTGRRPSTPQRGAAGTGVEQPDARSGGQQDAAVLPRSRQANSQPTPNFSQAGSSQTPVGGADDPRPSVLPAGLNFPAGVVTPPAEAPGPGALPPSAALAGVHRRRVVLHGHP